MLESIFEYQYYMQIAFIGCFALSIITLPLRDIVTVGFYDISDFFVTAMITFFIGYMYNESSELTIGIFTAIFIAVLVAIILMNIFVIIPFKSRAESSTVASITQLEGKEGKVSTTLTEGSYGEVVVYNGFTKINKMAKIYANNDGVTTIPVGTNVLVMDILDNVLYVLPYENSIKQLGNNKPTWSGKK